MDPDAYPPTADLVAASSNEDLLAKTPEQQEGYRIAAIGALEEYTLQPFTSELATRTVDGIGGDRLYLPGRLARLDSIEVTGTAISAVDVELQPDGDVVLLRPEGDVSTYYSRTLADLDPQPRKFTAGAGTARITGLWGWETIPDEVALALRFDMEDTATADANRLSPTISAYRTLGLRNITQGRMSAQIGSLPASGLSLRAQRAIPRRYVWQGRAGAWA